MEKDLTVFPIDNAGNGMNGNGISGNGAEITSDNIDFEELLKLLQ